MPRVVLFRLSETYFRHRWLYLLPILLLLAGGVAYFLYGQTKYQAQGVIYVQDSSLLAQLTAVQNTNGASWVTPAKQASDEINEMLKTDSFIRAVIQKTALESQMNGDQASIDQLFDRVRQNVSTTPIGNNQISVTASYTDPTIAVQLANGVTQNYLNWKSNAKLSENQTALSFFSNVIQEYQVALDKSEQNMRDYLVAHPDPLHGERPSTEKLEISRLQTEIDLASDRLKSALDKEENARLAVSQVDSNTRNTYLVIDAPRVAEKGITSRRDKAITSSLFLLGGILLSGAALLVNTLLDRSFYTPADVRLRTGLPVLAIFPDTQKKRRWFRREKTANPKELPGLKNTRLPERRGVAQDHVAANE